MGLDQRPNQALRWGKSIIPALAMIAFGVRPAMAQEITPTPIPVNDIIRRTQTAQNMVDYYNSTSIDLDPVSTDTCTFSVSRRFINPNPELTVSPDDPNAVPNPPLAGGLNRLTGTHLIMTCVTYIRSTRTIYIDLYDSRIADADGYPNFPEIDLIGISQGDYDTVMTIADTRAIPVPSEENPAFLVGTAK